MSQLLNGMKPEWIKEEKKEAKKTKQKKSQVFEHEERKKQTLRHEKRVKCFINYLICFFVLFLFLV